MSDLYNINFSPTGCTNKIGDEICHGLNRTVYKKIDLTYEEKAVLNLDSTDIAIIGMPVYRGGLPDVAIARFKEIHGNATPCVVYVVYGNRDAGFALSELRQLASSQGFIPVAGGIFIGEHSFSSSVYPIANNRPDRLDLLKASDFGRMVSDVLNKANVDHAITDDFKLIERKETLRIPSYIDLSLCRHCGHCVSVCPVSAIRIRGEVVEVDDKKCITCMACVKSCPVRARFVGDDSLKNITRKLHELSKERMEPEFKLFVKSGGKR